MKKSDLVTGMTVVARDGYKYRVIKGIASNYKKQDLILCCLDESGFILGSYYNDDLTCEDEERIIDFVYDREPNFLLIDHKISRPLIWERHNRKVVINLLEEEVKSLLEGKEIEVLEQGAHGIRMPLCIKISKEDLFL
jgi:hypothetical protein